MLILLNTCDQKKNVAANGKQLPQVLAEHIAELGFAWEPELRKPSDHELSEDHKKSIVASAMQLLSTLCTAFVKETDQETVVPKVLRDKLKLGGMRTGFSGT